MARASDSRGSDPSTGCLVSERQRRLTLLLKSRTALFGFGVLMVILFVAVGARWLAPFDPNEQALRDRLLPPTWAEAGVPQHFLGTDHLGRDILSRMIYGSRVSVTVGIVAVVISGAIGVVLGLIAGYYEGVLDTLTMRLVDVQLAFPFVLLALAIVAVVGRGLRNVIVVLGVGGWTVYARCVRADVLSVKRMEYVEAARALGAGDWRIMFRHILPNVMAPIVVLATFAVATNILLEATLTFLGAGVDPRVPTWGSMLADGRDYVGTAWWLTVFPGLAIVFTVLSVNLIGDWIRDAFDPRLLDG